MKLHLLFSILCVPDHVTVRGEYRVQPSLRRAVPEALPRHRQQENNPHLRVLILAHSACHPSEYCHRGHHHLLSEGPIPAEAGAEEAAGICSQGRHFILSLIWYHIHTVSASSNWLAPLDNRHGRVTVRCDTFCNHDTMSFLGDACTLLHDYPPGKSFLMTDSRVMSGEGCGLECSQRGWSGVCRPFLLALLSTVIKV